MSAKPKPDAEGFVLLGSIRGVEFKGRKATIAEFGVPVYELRARLVVNGRACEYRECIPVHIKMPYSQMIRMLARRVLDHVFEEHMDTEGKGIVYELDRL